MVFNEVTQGCMTVGTASTIDIEVGISCINDSSFIEVIGSDSGIIICDDTSDVEVSAYNALTESGIETAYCDTDTSVTCGLVCGVDIGLPVLYASDGVLITIDGQYLIVQRERN